MCECISTQNINRELPAHAIVNHSVVTESGSTLFVKWNEEKRLQRTRQTDKEYQAYQSGSLTNQVVAVAAS